MVKEKVSANQFFMLLYLSLLNTVFMYLSSDGIKIASTDTILRPVVFLLVAFAVYVPIGLIIKHHSQLTSKRLYIQKTTFLKILAFLYAAIYFISILKSLARFDLFVSSELFPNSDMTIFIVIITLTCAILSLLGLGALSRAAGVFSALVIISTVLVMVSLRSEINFMNFTPVFENGLLDFSKEGLLFAAQATEIGTIIMFLPEIEGNVKRAYSRWVVFSSISVALIFFFVVGSLGAFADSQLFPTYTAVTLASFGLLERIDALETGVWILCVTEKVAFYFLVVSKAVNYTFKKLSRKVIAIGAGALVSVIISFVSYNIKRFSFLSSDILSVTLFLLSTVILPITIYVYLRRVKPCEKTEANI